MFFNKLKNKIIYSRFYNPLVSVHTSPVIILGNQKSGTSAITALLAKATGQSVTIDIPPLWEPTFTDLIQGEKELQDLISDNKIHFSRKIIKEPNLTFLYPQMKKIFPNSKFVLIVREPQANIRSLLNRVNVSGDLSEFKDYAKLPKNWHSIFTHNFSEGQNNAANYTEILAHRWKKATEIYTKHPQDIQLVKYEDFTKNKAEYIYELAKRLDLEVKNKIESFVDIQYQPKGKQPLSYTDFFGEANLNKIKKICYENSEQQIYKET